MLLTSADHLPVMEYVSPERFSAYERLAYDAGLAWVKSGPFVRSSYHAVDAMDAVRIGAAADGEPHLLHMSEQQVS